MRVLVTGGAGFIGSNFIRFLHERRPQWRIVNYDALTYAGNPVNLADLSGDPHYLFVHADIR
ncbi:MAG: GDP-mannose 4,6-dehydratase, partial [Planctomycetota bacterium]